MSLSVRLGSRSDLFCMASGTVLDSEISLYCFSIALDKEVVLND